MTAWESAEDNPTEVEIPSLVPQIAIYQTFVRYSYLNIV